MSHVHYVWVLFNRKSPGMPWISWSVFANIVETLDIEGFTTYDFSYDPELDYISNIVEKFKTHPSILKSKEHVTIEECILFKLVDATVINDKIDSLDKRKPMTYKNIPTKVSVEK